MRFQTRLLLTYSVLIVSLVVALAFGFYSYSARAYESSSHASLSLIAEKMSQQLDNLIRPMDFVTTYLLSNRDFMSSMVSLANLDRTDPRNLIFINEGQRTINATLLSYSIMKNFYSVDVFNAKGDFLSSNFLTHAGVAGSSSLLTSSPWRAQADEVHGRALILSPTLDPWNRDNPLRVYGLARSVQGPQGAVGYVEVQNDYADLKRAFSVPNDSSVSVIAVMDDGRLFYANRALGAPLLGYYTDVGRHIADSPVPMRNSVTRRQEIIAGSLSAYTGITVVLAQDRNALLQSLRYTRGIIIVIALLIIAVSFVFNYLSSRQLTRPLRELTRTMERTGLENLPDSLSFESANDEIEALNNSFQRLRTRLKEAVEREISLQSLQVQAKLDSLQAQMNPHFMYNVLTVISSKGMESGNEEICEICDGIASMLRYSTSTVRRAATVGEEIEHVRTYLALMKKRFEHRLEYSIEVDPAILEERIPKIVLQQIAENSINHGYQSVQKIMRLCVRGYVENGSWLVEISDNGQGFDQATLERLRSTVASVSRVARPESRAGISIGGMGLVNTCSRLALFYDTRFVFTMENSPAGGAIVRVGAARGAAERETDDGARASG